MTKTVLNKHVCDCLEEWAPASLAYDWDNVGLQVGSLNRPVKNVMITLDVLESTADEAIEKNIDLIIAHHPLLFNPVKQLDIDSPKGRTIEKLLRHNITVFAAHTNLDAAKGGVNDMLADAVGLLNRQVMLPVYQEQLMKIVVYVPDTHAEAIRDAFHKCGAGHIGSYSHCTFQTAGQGTFKPSEGTKPYIGTVNELTVTEEVRAETIVRASNVKNTVAAVLDAHPYEEAAYDIYPLENAGETLGIGRVGELSKTMTLCELCTHIKHVLAVPHMRVTGDENKEIKKVAILGGSGEKYIHEAKKMGADAYITGDMTFHTAQIAEEMGLAIIDPGHYVEKIMKKKTKQMLEARFTSNDLTIIISQTNTEPFRFV